MFWLVDQGSMNGTYLNEQRVDGEVALRPGSRIRLESAEFEFSMPSLGDGEGTLMANPHEFSETLKGDSPMPMAPPPTTAGGELVKESPQNSLETMVNKEVPSQGFRPEPAPAAEPGSGRGCQCGQRRFHSALRRRRCGISSPSRRDCGLRCGSETR